MGMNENKLELRSINSLLKENFFIPSYQRGYRWEDHQVTDLLNDLWEFSQKDRLKDEFYCLQPIVIKLMGENLWEVIDGQQRITTIYILLTYLGKKRYSLEFDTRKDSESFLKDLSINNYDESNVDYYYISNAMKTIDNWFKFKEDEEEEYTAKDELYITLGKSTKFIWYEVEKKIDSIEIFTRINMGKIPLTNAELIKALLLSKNKYADKYDKQFEIASEWDRIEYKLQDEDFWYFLNSSNKNMSTKIEFIFDLIADKKVNEVDNFFTFHFFNKKLNKDNENIKDVWQEIKSYFLTFEEWYEKHNLYHMVGYLVAIGVNIIDIKKASYGKTKKGFVAYLQKKIKNELKNIEIENLDYENSSHKDITKILLLFNIETIIRNKSNMRFPFDKYKNENWSLEHIHAQNSKGLDSSEKRESWLKETSKKIKTINFNKKKNNNQKKILRKISNLLSSEEIKEDDFKILQEEIFKIFGNHELHSIDNLALLSGKNNSALNNSIFPVKRDLIMKLDKNASFIPICTKNVFLKYYSNDLSQIYFWSEKDREDYLNAMIDMLEKDYLPNKEKK